MNEQTKHTPGPWKTRGGCDEMFIDSPETVCLAVVNMCANNLERASEVSANARLIAAAPDLLAALQWAQARIFKYEGNSDVYEAADAAITKARGGR